MKEKSMKVSIIDPIGGHGGMNYYNYGLSMGLSAQDADVLYFTSNETKELSINKVTTLYVYKDMWTSGLIKKVWLYCIGFLQALQISKKKGVGVIHVHVFSYRLIDLILLVLSRFWRMKVVATVHDIDSLSGESSLTLKKLILSMFDGVIVHNETSAELLKPHYDKPFSVIPHGNYLPFIDYKFTSQDKGPTGNFRILFFGQIKDVKGLDLLLRAIAVLKGKGKSLELIVAGRPWKVDANKYLDLISELEIQDSVEINFRYIHDQEVKSFFERADLVVLPYRKIFQSGVLIFSMSFKIPVLCSNLSSFCELVRHGENGFLFESDNVQSLANEIASIMDNQKLAHQAAERAFSMVSDDLNWEKIGASVLKFYKRIDSNS